MSKKRLIVLVVCAIPLLVLLIAYIESRGPAIPRAQTLQNEHSRISKQLEGVTPVSELSSFGKLGTVKLAGKAHVVYMDKSWPRVFIRGRSDSQTFSNTFGSAYKALSKFGAKAEVGGVAGVQQRMGPPDSTGLFDWELSYQEDIPSGTKFRKLYDKRSRLREKYLAECGRVEHPPFKGYSVTSDNSRQFYLVHLSEDIAVDVKLMKAANAHVENLAAKNKVTLRVCDLVGGKAVG